jgi:hypothetical protein
LAVHLHPSYRVDPPAKSRAQRLFAGIDLAGGVLEHATRFPYRRRINTKPKTLLKYTAGQLLKVQTTPHGEDMHAKLVYCPFCDWSFNRWQHLRLWTIPALWALLETRGFSIFFCRNMHFEQFQVIESLPDRWEEVSWNRLQKCGASHCRQAMEHWYPRQFPIARETQFRLRSGHGRHQCALAVKT